MTGRSPSRSTPAEVSGCDQPKHTQEYHQQLLEVWHSGAGFMRHRYRRCGFSGAGNCCCGRAEESRLHREGT